MTFLKDKSKSNLQQFANSTKEKFLLLHQYKDTTPTILSTLNNYNSLVPILSQNHRITGRYTNKKIQSV